MKLAKQNLSLSQDMVLVLVCFLCMYMVGEVEACRCHRVHMLRSEGKRAFSPHPPPLRMPGWLACKLLLIPLSPSSHLSTRAPALQTCTTVPAGPSLQPQNIWFLKTSFFDLLQSQVNILPLYHCMEPHLSDIFWNTSSNSEDRGEVWVSSRYQRWTRGWMRKGWCQLRLSSYYL